MLKKILLLAVLLFTPLSYAGLTVTMPPTVDQNVALPTSDYIEAKSLAASSAKTFTVPSGARYIMFSATCANFYANYTTTATVPSDTTDGSASELNPTVRRLVSTVTAISVISPTACIITGTYYK